VQILLFFAQHKIDKAIFPTIAKQILDFYHETEFLYSEMEFKINLHSMFHMLTDILNFGPCFTHNCFIYESMNGILLSFINGKHANIDSALQAIQLMQMLQEIPTENMNSDVKRALNLMNKKNQSRDKGKINKQMLFQNCFSVGISYLQILNSEVQQKIQNLFPTFIETDSKMYQTFSQIKFNNTQYYALQENKTKTNNSGCIFKTNDQLQFGIINYFVEIQTQMSNNTKKSEFIAILIKPRSKRNFEHYQQFYKNNSSIIAIKIDQICERVMIIDVENTFIWTVAITNLISH
jgi:hypothetical protein